MGTIRVLITGGCGFIGAHIIEHILRNTNWDIVILDKLTYASQGFDRIKDINAYDDKRVIMFTSDITKPIDSYLAKEIGDVDYILHLAAETHVDNSITTPEPFVLTNVVGTMRMLDYAKTLKNLKMFIQFSTDEVTGPAPIDINYSETARINPTNPYSASKLGAEALAMSYANCYNLPIVITRTMNVFGERQHYEKYVPGTIRRVLLGEKTFIHAYPDKKKAGSRYYIHGRNVAAAMLFLIDNADMSLPRCYTDIYGIPQMRHLYNIVGEQEIDNLELAQIIAKIVGKPLDYELVDFHSSRQGHDCRYALAMDKMNAMGWKQPKGFEDSFRKMVLWTLDNKHWIGL